MSLETDSLLESHFDGDYICNYIMSQTFRETKPPQLGRLFENPAIAPYADSYMEFISRHIIFNQVASRVRKDFPDAVRVSRKYFRHGISILLSLMYCNRFQARIRELALAIDRKDQEIAGLQKEIRLLKDTLRQIDRHLSQCRDLCADQAPRS
jgi:hypothetical protein